MPLLYQKNYTIIESCPNYVVHFGTSGNSRLISAAHILNTKTNARNFKRSPKFSFAQWGIALFVFFTQVRARFRNYYNLCWLPGVSLSKHRDLPGKYLLESRILVIGFLNKELYFWTFSTAYNKCALYDAHAGHTRAWSRNNAGNKRKQAEVRFAK